MQLVQAWERRRKHEKTKKLGNVLKKIIKMTTVVMYQNK